MGQDKKQLTKLLAFVKELYDDPDNKDFAAGIQAIVLNDLAITTNEDIRRIKKILELSADPSIDYSFVKDIFVRSQLTVDNLRMENVLLNPTLSKIERFENFCVSAFLQVENILNYYYHQRFNHDISQVLTYIENESPFQRNGKEYKFISDIAIYNKIQAFCNNFFPYDENVRDFTAVNINKLRLIRNDSFHRAGDDDAIRKENRGEKKQSYIPTENEFRDSLKKLVLKVKEQLV